MACSFSLASTTFYLTKNKYNVKHICRCKNSLKKFRRKQSTQYTDIVKESGGVHNKLFRDIPGPRSYPVIGTLGKYLPVIGEYRFDRLHHNGRRKLQQFGSLVREEIVPGVNLLWVFTPEDIEQVFRHEGKYPERRSHLAIEKYRKDRPHIYNTGGLLPTNGPEWWRLRSAFQKGLSRPQCVRGYLPTTNTVIEEFITHIKERYHNKSSPQDFTPYLSRLFLELIALVAFDLKLGSFSSEEYDPNSRSSKLIDAALTTNNCILKTDNGPQLWKHVRTPLYRKLEAGNKVMEQVAMELVSEKMAKIKENQVGVEGSQSLLESYLISSELDYKDVVGMAMDMLLAGIDTTTYSSCFAFYHLACNPNSQKTLYEESCRLLPDISSPVTSETLSEAHYTKAVLKETFRVNPISVGIGRVIPQDMVLSGYMIPQGTVAVTQNQVSCKLPQYFPEPDMFIPERWLKKHPLHQTTNPFLVLPFGHGPRSCIARRLAEQNIHSLLLKIIRQFEIGWAGKHLDALSHLINKPDSPVLLTFKARHL